MGDSFTIHISPDLINKLARDAGGPKKRTKKSKPKIKEVPPKHQGEQNQAPAAPGTGSSGPWPVKPPMFLPIPSLPPPAPAMAELEAIRAVLQESEAVMKKLEEKEANMTRELSQRAKELRDKEFKLPYQKSMPCEAEREACRQCYQENSKDPLKCAGVVRSFKECARLARQQQQVSSAV